MTEYSKLLISNIILAILTIFIIITAGEIYIRVVGSYNDDGQFVFLRWRIKPYVFPTDTIRNSAIQMRSEDRIFDSDSLLGWIPRYYPHQEGKKSKMYIYNSQRIRVVDEDLIYNIKNDPKVLRIALFGDSFTHGDEVYGEHAWGYILETILIESGISSEVLNFGVGGYGMDQAYLRWERDGKAFSPDIVIFGLQFENVARNVNMFKFIYCNTVNPGTVKPRFIMDTNGLK